MSLQIDLEGQVALVTGASRGIGREIALTLASAGADVVAVARTADDLDQLAEEISKKGRRCVSIPADLSDQRVWEPLAEQACTQMGPVSVLVNVAGMIVRREPPDVTLEDFDSTIDLNLRATFFLTQAVGRRMLAARGGSIITISSLAAETVTRAPVTYQLSKAALVQMTRALAVRWGPTVRVNAVGPGYVATELNSEWMAEPDNLQWLKSHIALNRVGQPSDIAGTVAFLASAYASYITGSHILVEGGWHSS